MSDREFERPTGPAFSFGDRRGPATPEPSVVEDGWDGGLPSLLAEHRGGLADAESEAAHRWAAPAASGRHVLVVGCGAGHGAEALRAAGAASVVGVDRDPHAIDVATRQYGVGIRFVAAESSALPFADSSFGMVVCASALEEEAEADAALRELRRVLVPNGVLLVSLPTGPLRDQLDGSELREARSAEDWLQRDSLAFANRKLYRRRAALAAVVVDPATEAGETVGGARWLDGERGEDRAVLLAASDGDLPELSGTAAMTGGRDLRGYRETVQAWEQRARKAEADGAAKHWELVASREAQRRLRKRLWQLEHRPLRRIFRVLTGHPWKLSEGPPIRPPEREPEPWR
jgi:SAM-dependent methyltransferase